MTSSSVPTITRPDVALVLVGEWTLDVPARQRAAADAALAAWASVPWPGGLLSHACLLETDGEAVLHYMQWASEHACRGFVATDRADWARAVDTEVPGIQRHGVVAYRPPRNRVDSAQTPGCIVVIDREFDGPDLGRTQAWADAIFSVPGGDAPVPGLISAHVHISTDGARVLNYAEWTSEAAHRAMVEGAPKRIDKSPAMRQVEAWPGLKRTSFKRYHPYRSLTGPPG